MIELSLPMVVGLVLALVYLPFTGRAPSWPRSAIKTAPLLLFALAAWDWGAHPFLTFALILSAAGDFALSRDGDSAFLYGLASFALAHLLYLLLFLGLSERALWEAFSLVPWAAVLLVVLAVSTELWLAPHTGGLRWPVRAYVVLITAMGLAALTWPLGMLALGAGLFILSDFTLSIQLFRMGEDHPARRLAGYVVWITYILGQVLILLAAA